VPDVWVGPSLDYRLGAAPNVPRLSRSQGHLGISLAHVVLSPDIATSNGSCTMIKAEVVEVTRRRDLRKPGGGSADVPGEGFKWAAPSCSPSVPPQLGVSSTPKLTPRLFAGLPAPSWEPRRPITPIRDTCKAIRVARGWCK